jgi:hypothetical protein
MSKFPEKIERWCCPGKACGNTELELVSYNDGMTGKPWMFEYVRVNNGNSYTGIITGDAMERWLEETKDHIQEEMDVTTPQSYLRDEAVGKLNNKLFDQLDIPQTLTPKYDVVFQDPTQKDVGVWEIRKEPGDDPIGSVMTTYLRAPELPEEFVEKRQQLAEFLLSMATGYSWDDAKDLDDFHSNYLKDADDILRSQPHLLGLTTREVMGLDGDD